MPSLSLLVASEVAITITSGATLKWKYHFDEIFITGCTGSCNFDEISITGCTGSCQIDNFQCSQWWKFHQNDISISVHQWWKSWHENNCWLSMLLSQCWYGDLPVCRARAHNSQWDISSMSGLLLTGMAAATATTWWWHVLKTFSVFLGLCVVKPLVSGGFPAQSAGITFCITVLSAGNPPVTVDSSVVSPHKLPIMWTYVDFFVVNLNKLLTNSEMASELRSFVGHLKLLSCLSENTQQEPKHSSCSRLELIVAYWGHIMILI